MTHMIIYAVRCEECTSTIATYEDWQTAMNCHAVLNVVYDTNRRIYTSDVRATGNVNKHCSIPIMKVFIVQITAMVVEVNVK